MTSKDLSTTSITFPDLPYRYEIPLDARLKEFEKRFNRDNQIIILNGLSGTGKTSHLAQFVTERCDSCFSYFLSNNYWTWRQLNFVISLSKQMSILLDISINANQFLDAEKAKTYFYNLTTQVIDLAKKTNRKFYFVIDGLEWAFEGQLGERIIDIFPLPTHSKGLYLLGSINTKLLDQLSFEYCSEEPRAFSKLETKKYLEELNIEPDIIEQVHMYSDGVPGYISVISNLIESGVEVNRILDSPSKIEALAKIQWMNSNVENSNAREAHGALAFSLIPLGLDTLSIILNENPNDTKRYFIEAGLTRINNDGCYVFYPELLKRVAQERLKNQRENILQKLVKFYESHSENDQSAILLPEYYRFLGDYKALRTLLEPNKIISTIELSGDLSIIKRNVRYISEMAEKNSDEGIISFSILSSQLNTISDELIGESEVEALIALKQYERALKLAYSSRLLRTQVRFLSKIYTAMEQDGVTIPVSAINELSQIVRNLDKKELDAKEILNLAADLYPVLPDIATSMVDEVKKSEDELDPLDLLLMLSAVKNNNVDNKDTIEGIKSEVVKDIALIHTRWLSKLSLDELKVKVSGIRKTKTKEYIVRQWCLQNRRDNCLADAINLYLDVIVSSKDKYRVALRNLRQISDLIKYVSFENRPKLVNKFEIPLFLSIQVPIQEKVRLELNLAEAVYSLNKLEASNRLMSIYENLELYEIR